jgi:hypothetical protein
MWCVKSSKRKLHLRFMKEEIMKKLANFSFGETIAKNQPMLFSGSCFSAEIGARCLADGYLALANPGGTMLRQFNPAMQVVFTVSPVKHLRDGIIENSRSKAVLLDAVHQLADMGLCRYFPSYELVNDVLRDYSFYKDDFAHPNEMAIDFVYSFFKAGGEGGIRTRDTL